MQLNSALSHWETVAAAACDRTRSGMGYQGQAWVTTPTIITSQLVGRLQPQQTCRAATVPHAATLGCLLGSLFMGAQPARYLQLTPNPPFTRSSYCTKAIQPMAAWAKHLCVVAKFIVQVHSICVLHRHSTSFSIYPDVAAYLATLPTCR